MLKKIIFVSLLVHNIAWGQNTIGLPEIKNFAKLQYRAGAQNRQVRQDDRGVLYFANSEGVLTYDGVNWKTYPLPNHSIVRSVRFGPDGKLYVGGQDEMGYFAPEANGTLAYHSLKNLIPPAERSFTDVWEILFYDGLIFFQTSNKIFQVSGNHCTIFKSSHWRYLGLCNNMLIAQDFDKGILRYESGFWRPFIQSSALPAEYFITSLTSLNKDSVLLTTLKEGCFILSRGNITAFTTAFLASIRNMNISASAQVNDQHFAIATNLAGCFIINTRGELVQSFSRKEGLQNNNVLQIFLDREKNLWLGLDNGIDFIAYNNAIKHIYVDYLNEGSGYAAHIYHNQLYLGTSNGLYAAPLQPQQDLSYVKSRFSQVQNSKGQVWNLSEVNGKLLMGHHEGAFRVENNEAQPIDKSTGFWTFQPLSNILPADVMLAGTYLGVNFYRYSNGQFINSTVHANFESARFVAIENGNVWVSHPYKGVYRVWYEGNTARSRMYAAKEGVLSNNGNYIFKIRNQIILATGNGIFEYDGRADRFIPSSFYNAIFGTREIRYLKEDGNGNIWFVFEKTIGVADMQADKPQIIYFPELANKFVSGFEYVYAVDKNNVFIGGEQGFYHVNYEQYKKNIAPLGVMITTVKTINGHDSLLYGGNSNAMNASMAQKNQMAKIDHDRNSCYFEFAAPVYGQQSNITYSYLLDGFDQNWSAYTGKTSKEYTNLPAGKYHFRVKARNNLGKESKEAVYSFQILPPWYQSRWALALYALIFVAGNYALFLLLRKIFRNQQKKHAEEQSRLQYLHQLEMEKNEKEIIKLRNEKLEAEIRHKKTELASVAMHLVQKGELIGKIKDQMVKMKTKETAENKDGLKKIIKVISDEDQLDKQWEQFAQHFDTVHSDFISSLKILYPALTANELKLSAYLRMNLSTKEIAQLMNISTRGVEISRYRLRKKLGIATEVNLFEFLMNIHQQQKDGAAQADADAGIKAD